MGRIRVEPESSAKELPCRMCGGVNRLLHGYVYDDEDARAIYFLEWCDGDHPRRAAFLTIGIGRFADGTGPDDRQAFCFEWSAAGMGLTNEPARDRPDLLGAFLPRDVALAGPDLAPVWHVVDHIVLDDPRAAEIRHWLESTG